MFHSVGWTWNPITGCTHECKFCWAESLAKRWGKPFTPQFRPHFLNDKMPNDGSWIFVGSTGDLFCPGMKDEWIHQIIERIDKEEGDNKFLLQTKNPIGFMSFFLELKQIKDKIILGTTLETNRDTPWGLAPFTGERAKYMTIMKKSGFKTFLSLEPLSDFDLPVMKKWIRAIKPEAIEIGLENYTNYTTRPSDAKICDLVEWLWKKPYPYVLKNNLTWVSQAISEQISHMEVES